MMKLDFSNDAEQTLQKLCKSNRNAAKQVNQRLGKLIANPKPPDACKIKGMEGFMRIHAGSAYRIIYFASDDTLYIHLIGKRNDDEIYRQQSRLLQ